MPNAGARGVEIHAVIFGEPFDGLVLVKIRIFLVLNVVIERKHQLPGIVNLLRSDALKFLHHRRSIVVRHDSVWTDGHKVARP